MSPSPDMTCCAYCNEWVFSADAGAWPVDGRWAHGTCVPWHDVAFPFARTIGRGRATLERFTREGRASSDTADLSALVGVLDTAAKAWPERASWGAVAACLSAARAVARWCEAGPRPPASPKRGIPPWARMTDRAS